MPYSDLALRQLEKWGVSTATAEAVGIFDVPDASTIYPEFKSAPGLIIPYYDAAHRLMTFEPGARPFCRVRWLGTPQKSFGQATGHRYGQPAKSGTRAYLPLLCNWMRLLGDPAEPIVITEGEAKALAGCAAGFPTIALGGVYNFGGEAFLPELEAGIWRGRDVFIVFDSDAATNPNVLAAEARLVDELQRKRGGRCAVVRLPPADDGSKVGLDDFLQAHGAPALMRLLQDAPPLGALDAKVLSLNRSVAWIDKENLIYDLEDHIFMPKASFLEGNKYSTLKHTTIGAGQRSAPKDISVARVWLTHPHAQRFSEVLFRPGEGPVIQTDNGKPALNLWTQWETKDGDVQPFLDLSAFLFQDMSPEQRDLPLKLWAYKAQNPAEKIPLALVLIGQQGCGKTLFGECLHDAFMPWSTVVTSKSFHSEFQGWIERSLMALINEAEHEDMLKGGDVLKSLISDLKRPMNEKYRPARQVNSYTMYVLTSNKRAVGAFSADDRRMIVVDCPRKERHGDAAAQAAFYDRISAWKRAGGPKALLGWLLRYDLKGWRLPATAPMTPEKYLAYTESLTPVQALAEDMRAATDANIAVRWVDAARAWASMNLANPNTKVQAQAQASLESTLRWPIRPWYEPRELALMFPHLIATQLGSRHDAGMPAGLISRELREAGIPYLVCRDDPRGFRWQGRIRQYLVVCDFEEWKAPLTQADFERLMAATPLYGSMKR